MPRPVMPRWSVRVRILASILAVTTLGMTVAGATAYIVHRDRTLDVIDDRLRTSVETARRVVIGESAEPERGTTVPDPPVFADTREALEAVLTRVLPSRNESSLGIVDGVAAIIPGIEVGFRLHDDQSFVERIVREVDDGSVRIGTAQSPRGPLRYIAAPVTVPGSGQEGIYVTAYDVDAELTEIGAAFGTYAGVALVALVAIALVGWFVSGRLLAPIRQLRSAASRITASDLHERIPVVGRDDVSELTETINDMLARLDESLAGQRQLLDDVRHELKTPITIVRGHLELLDPTRASEVATARDIALDELDRMAGLVDDIEALADSGRAQLALAPTDVADLTRQVYAKASAMAGHDWELGEVTEGVVRLDARRMTQAWLQLADNAAKYSPAGEPIAIGSGVADGRLVLWVADRGPGIPAGMEARIFERFGRADTGRGIRGSGLGLPIVSAIAEAHGGRVTLRNSPRGATFGIVVPLGPEPDREQGEA